MSMCMCSDIRIHSKFFILHCCLLPEIKFNSLQRLWNYRWLCHCSKVEVMYIYWDLLRYLFLSWYQFPIMHDAKQFSGKTGWNDSSHHWTGFRFLSVPLTWLGPREFGVFYCLKNSDTRIVQSTWFCFFKLQNERMLPKADFNKMPILA